MRCRRSPCPTCPGRGSWRGLGYEAGAVTIRAACLAAPANGWAPGVEEIVLGRATQLAREALGEVSAFTVGDPVAAGTGFEQRFDGARPWHGLSGAALARVRGRSPGGRRLYHGVHGAGAGRVCGADRRGRAGGRVGGGAAAEPALARALLLAAERPREAVGVLGAVSLAVAALADPRAPPETARVVRERPSPRMERLA